MQTMVTTRSPFLQAVQFRLLTALRILGRWSQRVGKVLFGCLLVAYLSATSLTSWTDDPVNIERWPLPFVGSGPFRDLFDSKDGIFEPESKVLAGDTRMAVRIDFWSLDSMSDLTLLEITSGQIVLRIRQEFGSLFAYINSPNQTYRQLILAEVKSGKNQILSVFEKSSVAFSSRDVLSQTSIMPFALSDILYFSTNPSTSSLLVPRTYGSIHLRFASIPNNLESKSLFAQFQSNSQSKAIVLNTFLLFLVFNLIAIIIKLAFRRHSVRALIRENE